MAPLLMVAVLLCIAPATLAGAALRAGSYPPTTTSSTLVPPTALTETQSVAIGNHFFEEACGFLPDTTAPYTFTEDGNTGISVGTFDVDKTGCISVLIQTFDPHVTIDGGPMLPAKYTDNVIVATGTGENTAPRTYTLIFSIVQPSTPAVPVTTPASPGSTTGAPGSGSGSGSGSLAFTGTNALATAVGGLALLAAGGLLVLFTRRRSDERVARRSA